MIKQRSAVKRMVLVVYPTVAMASRLGLSSSAAQPFAAYTASFPIPYAETSESFER